MIQLVLGGARSGKSRYAEQLAINSEKKVIYVATAEARDEEMRLRIQRHQQSRPATWKTIEEPIKLANLLTEKSQESHCLLVDCLTLWLTNILFNQQGKLQEAIFKAERMNLLNCINDLKGDVIFVSNEVGGGIVPMDKMSRRFVDESGTLHQQLAQQCDKVILVTAGLAQVLK